MNQKNKGVVSVPTHPKLVVQSKRVNPTPFSRESCTCKTQGFCWVCRRWDWILRRYDDVRGLAA